MRHGCTVAVAAVFIAGLGLPTTAAARCHPRNPTACTPLPQLTTAAESQPEATAPLQLKRFMKAEPARGSVSRSATRKAARKPTKEPAKAASAPKRETPLEEPVRASVEERPASVAPKAIPTLSIAAPALAVAPAAEDRTVGFAAATEPWGSASAFNGSDEPTAAPPGVTIARFDEINEIDLAADAQTSATEHAAKSDLVDKVSLTSPANAAEPAPAAAAPESEAKQSWLSWLYEKLIDGVLTAALAIRSFFV